MPYRTLVILYGSQTGTAEDVAERIGRQGRRYRFSVSVLAMNDYPVRELIQENLVLFVCSTTGQGEEPDNMKLFWTFLLRKSLPETSLKDLTYSLIGLGDSTYLKFNFTAKRLHARLDQLGAKCGVEPLYADEQHELGTDGMIDPWLEGFWKFALELYPLPTGWLPLTDDDLPLPKYFLEDAQVFKNPKKKESVSLGILISNERVTSCEHFQDVRLIKLDVAGLAVNFDPGDVVVVHPENSEEDVKEFIKLLGLDASMIFTVAPTQDKTPLPPFLTGDIVLGDCARKYFDLTYIPKRSFFEIFWHFAGNDLEKQRLREFSTAAGQADLVDYAIRPRRTVLEVLADFRDTTANLPMTYLFDLIPPIRPRPFSIANSPLSYPGQIHILAAVVNFRTTLKKPRRGLCTTYLANLEASKHPHVAFSVKKGSLRMPPDNVPVIMVGPGTGCAPFRALIQDRTMRGVGHNYLFFGSRSAKADFFFRQEWTYLETLGLLELVTAFSRDQDHKIYVQHRIVEHKDKIWRLLNRGGIIYIAGNAKDMVPAVRAALKSVLVDPGSLSEDIADEWIKSLEKCRRLQIEAWC